MQNPVLTLIWAETLSQSMLPLVTFAVDSGEFSQKFSKPEVMLGTLYTSFAFVCDIMGPAWFDFRNVFKFYQFKVSFMYKYDLVGWAFFAVYFTVMTTTRMMWRWNDQRVARIAPHHT